MDSKTHNKWFGEIEQMILSLTNLVASTMEMDHSKNNGEVKLSTDQRLHDLSPLDRARARVRHIFSESTYARPLCIRCGGEGHIAKHCCKSLVCFACEKIGHKSRDCREIVKAYTHSSKVLSFTVNFNIRGDGERNGLQKSQWIWKKKENQEEEKNGKHERLMEEETRVTSDDSNQDDTMETYKVEKCGSIEQRALLTVSPVQFNEIRMEKKRYGVTGTEGEISSNQFKDFSHEETEQKDKAEGEKEKQETEMKDTELIEQIEANNRSPGSHMMHNLRLSGGTKRPRRSIRMQMKIADQYLRVH